MTSHSLTTPGPRTTKSYQSFDWSTELSSKGASLSPEWFGYSPYSDVGKETLGGTLIAIKRFRPLRGHRFSKKNLEAALVGWEKVSAIHPNIHRPLVLFDADCSGPLPVLVTYYMDYNIAGYVRAYPDVDKLALIRPIASALEYLHSENLTHGNIRASNILLNTSGKVYLTDVGILEALLNPEKLEYEIRWTAPERVLQAQCNTPACDVWSLGMTILEVYTGQHPFHSYTNGAKIVLAMGRGDVPVRPSPDVLRDERIWKLLKECWNYTPSQRPTTGVVSALISEILISEIKVVN